MVAFRGCALTLPAMPESASDRPPVIWDEPIPRDVIEEICQLMGHDPGDVVRVVIEPMLAFVTLNARDDAGELVHDDDGLVQLTHRHSIL